MKVAPASGNDYEWCARLMVSSEPWITFGRDMEGARAAVHRPGTELFVARDGAVPFGFLLLAPYGLAGAPYIACIAVAEAARGRGLGTQMLHWAERRYADRRNVFLLVSSFNTRAQQLYLRHGYEQVGEIPGYVVPGYSELIYRKRLA
jgi:ribosomal protein S18 acetylase RimI-like enzyme